MLKRREQSQVSIHSVQEGCDLAPEFDNIIQLRYLFALEEQPIFSVQEIEHQ